jgi:hypothetical protein
VLNAIFGKDFNLVACDSFLLCLHLTHVRKESQIYLYTIWFFYTFIFICGVEEKGVSLYDLKYCEIKFEFIKMIY